MVLGIGRSSFDFSLVNALQRATSQLNETGLRLATMQRIQRGSDDPSGLIASELQARDLAALQAASDAAVWSRSYTATADRALSSASNLLTDIHAAVIAGTGSTTSPEQREALQLEIDAAIDAFGRLGNTTFAGQPVFGSSHEFLVGASGETVSLDLPALNASLGGASGTLQDLRTGGAASLSLGQSPKAQEIVSDVHLQVLSARSSVGAFERTTLDSWERAAADSEAQLLASWSAIRDTDVAAESSAWVRSMVLADATFAVAKLANRVEWLSLTSVAGRSTL